MKDFQLFLVIIYSTALPQTVLPCLRSIIEGQSLPSFKDYMGGEGQIPLYHQAIISSYQFQCCGNLTEWRVDLHPGSSADNGRYTLNLQVWRPSPTVDNSYNLVGNNRFPALPLSNGGALVISPSPAVQIAFRSGDVVGVHIESARATDRGLVVLTTASFSREAVWLASAASQTVGGCSVSVGSNGGQLNTLLRGAPIITADALEYSCPRVVPPPTPCPTAVAFNTREEPASTEPKNEATTPSKPATEDPTPSERQNEASTHSEPAIEERTSTEPQNEETTPTEPAIEEPTNLELSTEARTISEPTTKDSTAREPESLEFTTTAMLTSDSFFTNTASSIEDPSITDELSTTEEDSSTAGTNGEESQSIVTVAVNGVHFITGMIGTAVALVVCVVVILIILILVRVWRKRRETLNLTQHTTLQHAVRKGTGRDSNATENDLILTDNCGVAFGDQATSRYTDDHYVYCNPIAAVDPDKNIGTQRNVAYATGIVAKKNDAYTAISKPCKHNNTISEPSEDYI